MTAPPPPSNGATTAKRAIVLGARGKVGSTVTALLNVKGFQASPLVRRGRPSRPFDDNVDADGGPLPPPGAPLWVCTTTDGLGSALLSVPEERRPDCIVLQNGVVTDELRGAGMGALGSTTRVVLYLRAGAAAAEGDGWEDGGGRTLVSCSGLHREHAALVLPGARVAETPAEFARAARDKLAWACSAWLLSCGGVVGGEKARRPLSLGEVAEGPLGDDLRALAMELAPAAAAAVKQENGVAAGGQGMEEETEEEERASCADAVVAYCLSIAAAVPSRELALREWRWRNGAVLRAAEALGGARLPMHARWCERAGVRLEV
jgi:hypothetical protein